VTERPVAPTPEITSSQARAADPQSSVWVSANAGAGKTHVLTNRVLRLLLTGVPPAEILCLTYTKAAAAEMRARVTDRLGKWAVIAAEKLESELIDLTGAPPDDALTRRARTLFAHALDTPGGLKINTIHAFCESVLHRFPLEAGVPFGFSVIEDAERALLVRRAREKVFAEALDGGGPLSGAVDTLFAMLSDRAMEEAVTGALSDMRKLMPVLADTDGAKARLRRLVGADQIADPAALRRAVTAETLLTRENIALVRNECAPKPGGARAVDRLAEIANPGAPTEAELIGIFFTTEGGPRKSLLNKQPSERFPALLDTLVREQARLVAGLAEIARAELVLRSEALLDVLAAIVADYQRQKRARAWLDFDDLVTRTAALFGDPDQGAWVRYKLDAGITHILVDESQDTNPEQWKVVDALAEEFFAGEGAAQKPRSLFAVGDPKQSIFSFQGAEPALFGRSGEAYRQKARAAGRKFDRVPMGASFRTLKAILEAVDLVFHDTGLTASVVVGESYEPHVSARVHDGGRVALWPLVEAEKEDETDPWRMPASSAPLRSPARELATRIAGAIADWIARGRMLQARKPARPITASDVLILVQSRNALFHELIRALKKAGLSTPGADRLDVGRHIATSDLLALGDVLLNAEDDLTLAALLRSPLFDVDEDDLFRLAHRRDGSLFAAMASCPVPSVVEAHARLDAWRRRLDFERPFEFFADVLYAGGGLRRFHARLGSEVDDVIAEFLALALAHEQSPVPSLQGFVADMRSRSVEIKRELGEAENGVRVMTIHGAKGLEAPVVILADAASRPQGSQTRRELFFAEHEGGPILFHAARESQHTQETLPLLQAEKQAQTDEYWRKLYVGMTRAEDELHIAGVLGSRTKIDDTWYGAVASALGGRTATVALASGLEAALFPAGAAADAFGAPIVPPVAPDLAVPPAAVALAKRPALLTPSTSGPEIDVFDAGNEAIGTADAARRSGIALHALLQHLPGVPEGRRHELARAALVSLLPEAPDGHEAMAETACALLANPALAFVFGPGSRAELPILAKAEKDGRAVLIAGRVDRLVVTPATVTIVDFKSDARPPEDASGIPSDYVSQLALYRLVLRRLFPEHRVEAALLWTARAELMTVPAEMLDAATAGIALC